MLAGTQYAAGAGLATLVPPFDFETYSEAGYRWLDVPGYWKQLKIGPVWEPPTIKLASLDGIRNTERGLGVVGVRNYVQHPTFEILSLRYDLLDGQGCRFWRPPILADLFPASWRDNGDVGPLLEHVHRERMLSAWNAGFEWTVWNFYCVPVLGWPKLDIEQLVCDMAKARAHALPGALAKAGAVQRLTIQKDPDGDRLLKKFSMPRNPTKTDPRTRIRPDEDPDDAARLYAYNDTDIYSELESSSKVPDLSPLEREIWLFSERANHRGMQVDLISVDNLIAVLEQAHVKYNAELRTITNNAVEAASEVEALRVWCNQQGCMFGNLDAEVIEDALKRRDAYPPAVVRALEIRSMLGAAGVKKLYSIRAQATPAGRLYDLYMFFAARTGRWNGVGPQPMNLIKGKLTPAEVEACLGWMSTRDLDIIEKLYGNAVEAIGDCIRGLFIAGPGCDFVSSDYSAIEGVTAACLAGEARDIEVYRTHGMIYEAAASDISGIPFEEFVKHRLDTGGAMQPDGTIRGGKHHPLRNKQGKFAVLACGFGGWVGALIGFGADEFLTEDEMKAVVLGWRRSHPYIVEMWGGQTRGRFQSARPEQFGLEGCAIAAVENPGLCYTYRGVSYQMHGDCLYCSVPSGGLLTYHCPRLAPTTREWAQPWEKELSFEGWNSNPKKGPVGWIRMKLYGGLQFENVVQKVGRGKQAAGLVRLDRGGYPIVMHGHDEFVSEVPEGFGSVVEAEAIVNVVEPWQYLPDGSPWPIKAKGGWRGKRYRKDD